MQFIYRYLSSIRHWIVSAIQIDNNNWKLFPEEMKRNSIFLNYNYDLLMKSRLCFCLFALELAMLSYRVSINIYSFTFWYFTDV